MGERKFVITQFPEPKVNEPWRLSFTTIPESELKERLADVCNCLIGETFTEHDIGELELNVVLHGKDEAEKRLYGRNQPEILPPILRASGR